MPLLKSEVDCNCPYCDGKMQTDFSPAICNTCGTTITLDEKANIKDYEVPEYHGIVLIVSAILAFIFCVVIIFDASLTDHANEKLSMLGVVLFTGVIMYFLLPLRMSLSREYSRTWVVMTIAIALGGVMILHLGDMVQY